MKSKDLPASNIYKYNKSITASKLPSGLAARVVTRNCQLVTIWAGSRDHDSELPASYHWGKIMIDRAGREEAAEGLWRECG